MNVCATTCTYTYMLNCTHESMMSVTLHEICTTYVHSLQVASYAVLVAKQNKLIYVHIGTCVLN